MTQTISPTGAPPISPTLNRHIGFWGLMFVSLGSIIGSGWLLGALYAAEAAGPASLISWVLAAVLLTILALVHAELGAAYPAAGGTARFPYFAFGTLAGFTAGWVAWLQAVTIAPIEVEASLSYLSNIGEIKKHFSMVNSDATLNARGLVVATVLMAVFTAINLVGVKFLAESNTIMVILKVIVPSLTVILLLTTSFHGGNFHAGGGFAPFGAHGIFAALPAGVVFALQGFEQAIQMGGEARNPQRDISRAVIVAMAIGASLYILLEIAFIGGLDPANLVKGWADPVTKGDFGPYATIATAAGIGWLATLLYIDAFISPAGTGLIYVGTSSRLSYALGKERTAPRVLASVNARGVPFWSIVLAFVIGELCFLPFPSWSSLVGLLTSATAIMYAFAPVSLAALRKADGDRPRPYRTPAWQVLTPLGFIAANLVIYWSGFEATWKITVGIFVGRVLFEITLARTPKEDRPEIDWRAAQWIWPWLMGLIIIGYFGRYGGNNDLPDWIDLVVMIAYSLVIYYFAVSLAMSPEDVRANVEHDKEELLDDPMLSEG